MDNDRLQKILENYKEKYESFNTEETNETYKWTAVSRFQKYWDFDAPNFGEMFKTAMDGAEGLINEATFQPINGVAYLCRQSREMAEVVKDEFRKLLTPDDSDYAARQRKAEAFVTAMNQLLMKVDSGKWKYHQEMSSALLYLNFSDPEDNYLYLEEEVKQFVRYLKIEDEIVLEDSVNLPNYYHMCDKVGEELQQHPELLEMVAGAVQDEADDNEDSSLTELDSENHILVFDIIYCAKNHTLYDADETAPKRRRRKKTLSAAELEKQRQDALLKEELHNLTMQLDAAKKERRSLKHPKLKGHTVLHKKFGKGKVTVQEEQHILVVFDSVGEKKFLLPDAFTKGFLTANASAEEVNQTCKRIAELDAEIHKLQVNIRLDNLQINGLEE